MPHNYDHPEASADDFAADSSFRKWVKNPDAETEQYWQTYLATHPEQAERIAQAAELVRAFSAATHALTPLVSTAEKRAIWTGIQTRLQAGPRTSPFRSQQRGLDWAGRRMAAAASVALLLGAGWWFYSAKAPGLTPKAPSHTTIATTEIDQTNTTNKPRLISLPDGSSLLLHPQSQIRYARQFTGGRRAVHLRGEAFFEVVKDPSKPFWVYTDKLVTKVVGTSFSVKAYPDGRAATVAVRTGRVAVYTETSADKQPEDLDSTGAAGIVVLPNQQFVYARQAVAPKPVAMTRLVAEQTFAVAPPHFVFDARPVGEVFELLEKTYGVPIRYDRATLGTCRLTADLTDEPLSEKLLIICKSIEAAYTLNENLITVSGPGCRP